MATGDQDNVEFGYAAGTAGDVNGDGFADVIVSAPWYDNGQIDEGRAYLYLGSAAGLGATPEWTREGNQQTAYLGWAAGTAGDVNGDGYADTIVGCHRCSHGQTREGQAFIFYGNDGSGLDLAPRQMRVDGSAPIAPLGLSDDPRAVQLWMTGRMPLGREDIKLQWQVAPLGTPFTATHVISGTSAAWTDVLSSGVVISQNVEGLTPLTAYHWRARLLYPPGNRLGQSASRWLHMPWNGWNETDFRTVEEPIAGLMAYNDSPTALGHATTLTATITTGSNVTYTWALGDGTGGSGAVLTHTYPAVGAYMAIVTATNSVSELTATTTVMIEESITGLVAYNDSPTVLGNTTTLTATLTTGSNVTYTWAFGDGTGDSGAVLTHIYPAPGIYTAEVTATNSVSVLTATTTVTIVHRIYLPLISATWPQGLGETETEQNNPD
jgi:hypothetical protein